MYGKEFSMGMRRRTRRRALVAGAVVGGAVAHHAAKSGAQQQADDQVPADDYQDQAQYAPPPVDPADEIEHLAQLHASGALTDDEFAAAKAKALGT
jgi:Short C-terminal domain